MPFPKDQFSLFTSTRLTNTSSSRTPSSSWRRCATVVKKVFFNSTVAFVERYLNKNDAVCARNIEIFGIVDEGPLLMLRDDLEVILGWDVNGVHHRAINNRSNVFATLVASLSR